MSNIVVSNYIGIDVECPICGERMEVKVSIEINDVRVLVSGMKGTKPQTSTRVDSSVLGAQINHDCRPPRVKHQEFTPKFSDGRGPDDGP